MSEYIHKSHNVSVLMYHFVCPAKYRRVVIDEEVDKVIQETCKEIEKRYEIRFIEVETDKDHVHFLIQSVPTYSIFVSNYLDFLTGNVSTTTFSLGSISSSRYFQ